MKPIKARATRALCHGSWVDVCDNSGAKVIKITSVLRHKTVKGRYPTAAICDIFMGSVVSGKPEMRKTVVYAVLVRQRREFRRLDGTRIKFEDNACAVLKDKDGNPKGTMIKGPIAKEIAERWPMLSKLASIIL
jgi:large subunit ribosomal protein L14